MQYKIEYSLNKGNKNIINKRFYNALDSGTAREMFKATCQGGSLTGEDVEVKAIYKQAKKGIWKRVKA